jgi:hypothetical protein
MDIRTLHILHGLDQYFIIGEHVETPSSWWDESMLMISEDPDLPLELRLYISWNPDEERSHGNFVWFCPWHVFRREDEESYVLAQDITTKQWIEWSKTNGWRRKNWITGEIQSLNGAPFSI